MTRRPSMRDRLVRISSCTPPAKNAFSVAALILTRGRTAMDLALSSASPAKVVLGATLFSGAASSDVPARRSQAINPIAMANKATRTTSSFFPVSFVVVVALSTSVSRLMPSGVSSNAQAKNNAKGNPMMPIQVTKARVQPGRLSAGETVSVTCTTTQPSRT